jgi:hypothetical protein
MDEQRPDELAEQLRPVVAFMRANYWNATSAQARREMLTAITVFERYDATRKGHPDKGVSSW